MSALTITTYADLTEHLLDFAGANPGGDMARDARRAAVNGMTLLAQSGLWSYYMSLGRIATSAPYSTGTIEYDHTGGTYERLVTLTTGVWPAWSVYGTLILGNIAYDPVVRLSDSTLQLSINSNPGEDIAAGSTYNLYRDTYPLPLDCTSADRAILVAHATWLEFEHPSQWLVRQQIYRGPALPRYYTIRPAPDYMGTMAMSFFPAPDNQYEIQFMYNRQPRPMRVENYSTGKATITALGVDVTGIGTAWDSVLHTGCVMRFSSSTTTLPTSPVGTNPATLERVVVSVNSATSITLDQAAPATLTGVAYLLSDAADIEPLAMRLALLRASEYQLAVSRNRRDRMELEQAYFKELIRAREVDSRNNSMQSPRTYRPFPTRLADMPRGPDA